MHRTGHTFSNYNGANQTQDHRSACLGPQERPGCKGSKYGGKQERAAETLHGSWNPVQMTMPEITEGWEGKPKGMLQILFERGFINPERMTEYTVDGRNDVFGNLVADTSLRYLMEQLSDFQDEETLL
jgi:hypothetical protein